MYDPLYYLSTYIVFLIVEQLIITYNNNCYDCKQIKTDTCIFFLWKNGSLKDYIAKKLSPKDVPEALYEIEVSQWVTYIQL